MFQHGLRLISYLLFLFALASCTSEPGGVRPPLPDDPVIAKLANKRVLWVAPHADDELVVAPVLAEACVYRGARCTLLLTTPNTGWCPHGPCSTMTDTVALRMAEHRAAAQILHAKPAYLQPLLPNTNRPSGHTGAVLEAWSAASGGYNQLLNAFVQALHEVRPEVVITFDPRHGAYCHPEHRVTAKLVVDAVARSGSAVEVLFSANDLRENRVREDGILGIVPVVEEPGLLSYDASRRLSESETAWTYVRRVLAAYPSQFPPQRVLAAAMVPPSFQRTYLMPAAAVGDVSESFCSNS